MRVRTFFGGSSGPTGYPTRRAVAIRAVGEGNYAHLFAQQPVSGRLRIRQRQLTHLQRQHALDQRPRPLERRVPRFPGNQGSPAVLGAKIGTKIDLATAFSRPRSRSGSEVDGWATGTDEAGHCAAADLAGLVGACRFRLGRPRSPPGTDTCDVMGKSDPHRAEPGAGTKITVDSPLGTPAAAHVSDEQDHLNVPTPGPCVGEVHHQPDQS